MALVESEDMEVVPGSHCRDFTPAEHHICRDDLYPHGPDQRSNDMPGSFRPKLQPGDAILFNSISIHRGRYHSDKLRRTLMVDFTKTRVAEETLKATGLNQYSDQPYFLHPDYLAKCAPSTVTFLGGHGFCDLYRAAWRANLTEHMKYRGLIDLMLDGRANKTDQNPFKDYETGRAKM